MEPLVALIAGALNNKSVERAAIYHINNPEDAKLLEASLKEKIHLPDEVITQPFTPGLSVHAGDGLVGAAFYAK